MKKVLFVLYLFVLQFLVNQKMISKNQIFNLMKTKLNYLEHYVYLKTQNLKYQLFY